MYYKKTYYQSLSITIAYDAHGTLAGAASEFRKEGTFWSGFASGAVASFVSTSTGIMTAELPKAWQVSCMVAAGGLSGGVTSTMAGGDFWDGVCNGLICAGLNHAMHLAAETMVGPDDPPDSKKNKVEKTQNTTNKIGTVGTLFNGALKITKEATGGLNGFFKTFARTCNTLTGAAIVSNGVINWMKYRNGEIDLYSMCARDGMTLLEFATSIIPFGIGTVPSITLTAYDIEGGFEQTLYNSEWMETQLFRLDQHLYQYKADPGYQPIYYRHGK